MPLGTVIRNVADTRAMRVPDEAAVAGAVRRVLSVTPRVETQRELLRLVLAELRGEDPSARLGSGRLRRIALSTGAARIEIDYRTADSKGLPYVCPVCGNPMAPVMNTTLDGDATEFKRRCTVCPYATQGQKVPVPGKYVFVRAPAMEVPEEELRVRKLRLAAARLREASRLIGEALEGTDFPERGGFAQSRIDEIVSSKSPAGSIPNLIADVKDIGREDPLWVKPASTPKYPDRPV